MSFGDGILLAWIAFNTLALIILGITFVVNVLTFPKLTRINKQLASTSPLVSILIPARNEAANISTTLKELLNQTYQNYEIVVLDDQSSDATKEVVLNMADNSPNLELLTGENLPDGWSGKNWACHQLSQVARGELLLFTDADVRWHPDALASLLQKFEQSNADLLTIWPTQITITPAERLTVPLIAMVILSYLPLPAVHHLSTPSFAAANGQCLLFTKNAYEKIGGHTAVKSSIVEDIELARNIKTQGLKLRMADGNQLISCRMYTSWSQVFAGFAKNILAGHANSPILLLLSAGFHWSLFLFPWAWLLLLTLNKGDTPFWHWWAISMIIVGTGIRAGSAAFSHQRIQDAAALPFSVILFTLIAAQALWWRWRYGGPIWKGRLINPVSGNPRPSRLESGEEAHETRRR